MTAPPAKSLGEPKPAREAKRPAAGLSALTTPEWRRELAAMLLGWTPALEEETTEELLAFHNFPPLNPKTE